MVIREQPDKLADNAVREALSTEPAIKQQIGENQIRFCRLVPYLSDSVEHAGEVKDQMRKIDSSFECREELQRVAAQIRGRGSLYGGVDVLVVRHRLAGIFELHDASDASCKPLVITYRGCVS